MQARTLYEFIVVVVRRFFHLFPRRVLIGGECLVRVFRLLNNGVELGDGVVCLVFLNCLPGIGAVFLGEFQLFRFLLFSECGIVNLRFYGIVVFFNQRAARVKVGFVQRLDFLKELYPFIAREDAIGFGVRFNRCLFLFLAFNGGGCVFLRLLLGGFFIFLTLFNAFAPGMFLCNKCIFCLLLFIAQQLPNDGNLGDYLFYADTKDAGDFVKDTQHGVDNLPEKACNTGGNLERLEANAVYPKEESIPKIWQGFDEEVLYPLPCRRQVI